MNNYALNILENYDTLLNFSETISLVTNNDTNSELQQDININVEDPISFNCYNKITDTNIPYSQLNNLTGFDEKDSMFPDYTGESNTNYYSSSNSNNENIFTKKQMVSFGSAIIENNIILFINKPTGFDDTIKESINHNGRLKLFNSEDILIYTKENLIENLYNNNIINYLISDDVLKSINIENRKKFLLNYFNELPLELSDTDIFIKDKWDLNNFLLKIPVNFSNNILSKIVNKSSNDKFISITESLYEIDFKILFDIDTSIKFPLNFMYRFDNLINSATNLMNNKFSYKIVINDFPADIDFINNINTGVYKNLYLIFI